jgi:hypothetical protein
MGWGSICTALDQLCHDCSHQPMVGVDCFTTPYFSRTMCPPLLGSSDFVI